MSNQKLSVLLKIIIVIMALLGVGAYGVVLPWSLSTFVEQYPEFSYFYMPWLIFLLITALPLYAILALGWSVSCEMKKDMLFTKKNAKSLRFVAILLGGDAVFFFIGNIVYGLLNINHPGVAVAAFFFSVFVVLISAAVAILASMIDKASVIREENESII
ncbi:MAG: DUF2975 domain-containing protein [Ruminococcus sp.]|nr:DUF2975 domain-containing protein [Ruminococcus sp.]